MVRVPVVNALVSAANEGMIRAAEGSTSDEVYSAYMTLALRAVRLARRTGGDMQQFRSTVQQILMECTDQDSRN